MNCSSIGLLWLPMLSWFIAVVSDERTAALTSNAEKLGTTDNYFVHMEKLRNKLMVNYTATVRPVRDANKAINIEVIADVYHIEELNEAEQTFTMHSRITLIWTDEYLKWKNLPTFAEFQDVDKIQIAKLFIWNPHIGVYNCAQGRSTSGFHDYYHGSTRAFVNAEGMVISMFDTAITTVCPMSLVKYPYDIQKCPIALGSQMYSMQEVNMDYIAGNYYLNENKIPGMELFHASGWNVKHSASRKRYWTNSGVTDEKPERLEEGNIWAVAQLDVTLQRSAPYFWVIMALPCFSTLLLTLVSFWIPAWDIMVFTFCTTIFLQAFFLSNAAITVPKAVDNPPKIIVFYGINLSITIAAFTFCVLVKLEQENDFMPDSWSESFGRVISSNKDSFSIAKQHVIKTVSTLRIKSSGAMRQEDAEIIENDDRGEADSHTSTRVVKGQVTPKRQSKCGGKKGCKCINHKQKEFQRVLLKRVVFGIMSVIEILGWLAAVLPI